MLKKAKFHYEAAAMTGHEVARNNLGCLEGKGGNVDHTFLDNSHHLGVKLDTKSNGRDSNYDSTQN
jgi:hypothetical protein